MKKNEFTEGLDHINAEIVESYIKQKDSLMQRRKTQGVWLRIVAIVACLAVLVGAAIILPMLSKDNSSTPPPTVPIWDGAQYSADEVAGLFDSMKNDSVATNAYTKIYVPDSKYLYLSEIPDEALLGIYQYNDIQKELDEKALKDFIDGFLPQLAASIGKSVPEYKIEEHSNSGFESSLSVSKDIGDYRMLASQYGERNSFTLYKYSIGDRKIVLDGETVQIDQRLSDEEIIASLGSIKNKLFEIFGVSFSDTKIIRSFNSYSEHGATSVSIYFYDKNAHPLNSVRDTPISDYICISFENHMNYSGDIVSDGILTVADIRYSKNRNNVSEAFQLIANTEMISIEDAEALLYNGYVFGGHSCPLCMAEQEKISFDGYDFVGLEYVFGIDEETYNPTLCIPFYAFYKKIGTSENGNLIYAKTYVAAIAVSGYKEYFESQRDDHKNNNDIVEEVPY